MKKKYIFWDNDGVLVDTERWFFEANRKSLKEVGIYIDEEQYIYYMQSGISVWDIARKQGISADIINQKRELREQYYQDFLITKDIEIPGVLEALESLKKYFNMGVVTTSRRVNFNIIHSNRKILDFMDFVLTIEDYERAKPAPDPYLKALEICRATKAESIIIEDSGRGLKAAIAAEIDCIVVRNKFTEKHNFDGAKHIENNISDACEMIIDKYF